MSRKKRVVPYDKILPKVDIEKFSRHVGTRLVLFREKFGYTQDAVGDYLGCGKANISKWENGEALPQLGYIADLCTLYGCTYDELLGNFNDMDNPNTVEFIRRTPASPLVSGSTRFDIARGIQILTALISGKSLEEIYTLEGLSAFKGNRDAIFGFLRSALISGEITFTHIPQAKDVETRLQNKFPQVRGSVHVIDLPETVASEALPPELVAWTVAYGVLSTLDKPPRVGIGNGYTLHRMCMVTPPSVQRFSGTQWIPLITYRDEEEVAVTSANYCAMLMKYRHHNSTAMYLPYVATEQFATNRHYEEIHKAWERLNIAFVGGYGWSNEENARVPSSYRRIYRRLEQMGQTDSLAGEFLGYVLDHDGNILGEQDTKEAMDESTTRIPLSEIQRCIHNTGKVYFVGANKKKASIVRVALKCGYINGLVIDRSLANELLE